MLDNVNCTLCFRDPNGTYADFSIRCGIINRLVWEDGTIKIPLNPRPGTPSIGWEPGVSTTNATDVRTLNITRNVYYDIYIGNYNSSNKLENLKAMWTAVGTGAQGIVFYDPETYNYIRLYSEWYGSEQYHRPYLCLNLNGISSLDIPEEITKDNFIGTILKYIKTYFNSTLKYTHGCDRENTLFMMLHGDAYDQYETSVGGGNVTSTVKSYADLHRFWTGNFYVQPNYFKLPDDTKIYTSKYITDPSNTNILIENATLVNTLAARTECQPYVGWNIQTGTNIGKFFTEYNTSIMLKNGSTITLKKEANPHTNYSYNAYKCSIEFANRINPESISVIESSFCIAGRDIATQAANSLKFNDCIGNSYYQEASHGIYILETPDSNGNLTDYIDSNEGEPATFWDRYPTAPVTIGYRMCVNWATTRNDFPAVVTAMNSDLGNTVACGFYMVCNQFGFVTDTSYFEMPYVRWQGMTAKIEYNSGMSAADAAILPILGEFSVGSGEKFYVLLGVTSEIDPDDPTGGGGSIGGGSHNSHNGGNGSYDDTGDNIGFSTSSSINSTNSVTNWYIGEKNSSNVDTFLDLLGNWLRTTGDPDADHPFEGLGYKYSDKLANIVSLKIIYSPSGATISGPLIPHIHGQILHGSGDANPTAYKVTNQFKQDPIRLNFNLSEYFGSFLDYAPYTEVKIYLPFAGVHTLNPSNVMNKDLSLYASVDWMTGDIVYNIRINTGTSNSILYTFTGNAGIDLPLTAVDYSGKISAGINTLLSLAGIVGGVMGAGATGGASLGLAAGSVGSLIGNMASYKGQSYNTQTTGGIGGVSGALSPLQPYLMVTRPKKVQAEEYGSIYGYPCMESYKLGDLSGYVLVGDCNWSIPGATEEEIDEINNLMKTEGAIL